MARARNIKPGFYKNEDLAECSIWARFIFPGLWTLADRDGRLEDRPKRIKAELLPFDGEDVEPLLRELHERKFILRYANDDGKFVQILKFATHQSPHYSEKKSVIKPPDSGSTPVNSGDDGCDTLREQPEYSEKTPPIKRGSQPPESLVLIPDSPNPDSGLSDSPNPEPRGTSKATPRRKAGASLPDWLPRDAWDGYVEMRKKIRAPLTDRAQELAIRSLYKLRGEGQDVASVLDQSTQRSWRGVFPVKPDGADSVSDANQRAADEFVRQGNQEWDSDSAGSVA